MSNTTIQALHPGFFRRLASMFYDWVLLVAVILVAVTVFTLGVDLLLGKSASQEILQHPVGKLLYQLYLLVVGGLFYIWFWTHGGQTLGMKVWKIKLLDNNLKPVTARQAGFRLLFAIASCIPLGLGFFWMLFNQQRQTLYDRWSNTQLVEIETGSVNSDDE